MEMTRTGQEVTALELWQWPSWGNTVLFALGAIGAVMTAFYMSRLVFGIFWGDFKGWKIVRKWKEPAHDDHHDHHHHDASEPLEGPTPKESPWQITVPLLVLGFLSIVGGLLNAHLLHITPLEHWLEPVFKVATDEKHVKLAEHGEGLVMIIGLSAVAIGLAAAFYIYIREQGGPAKALAEKFPGLHQLVLEKWRIDELYEETFIGAVDSLAEAAVWFDKVVVDGVIARATAFIVQVTGSGLRLFQTGRVQTYAAVMVVGVGGLGWFLVAPHARTNIAENAGNYRVEAAPGFGYQYRWDADGDGKWDSEKFGDQTSVSFSLDHGKTKKVRLQVKNAFGRVTEDDVDVTRPKADPAAGNTVIQVQQLPDGTVRGVVPGQNPQMPNPHAAPRDVRRPAQ